MKKLLLIATILLSVNCSSQSKFEKEFQDADSAFSLKFEFSKPCEWLRINQDTSKVKIVEAELLTIKLLMKYKTECFNDSTRLYEWSCWEGAGFESKWEELGYKPFNCECGLTGEFKYKHKEPTFSDFLNWLSKEYGN